MEDDAKAKRALRLKRLDELSQIADSHRTLETTPTRPQVSKAPAPLEPVRGRGAGILPRPEVAKSQVSAWKLWTSVPQVELWEAVALVLDIDPRSLSRLRGGWMAGHGHGPSFEARSFPSDEKCIAFDEAYLFARKAARYGGPISLPMGYPPTYEGSAAVSLREVVAYFVGCDWPDIPAPLLALVPTAADMTAPLLGALDAPGIDSTPSKDDPPHRYPATADASEASWPLKKPQRDDGLAGAIYRVLKAAQHEGASRPTARDVLEAFRGKKPTEIVRVLADGCDFFDRRGDVASADLDSIRKRISAMTAG